MSDCIFCRIAERTIPSRIVHEDDQTVAFEDIDPKAPVHILIIPRRHIASLKDMNTTDSALLGHLMLTGVRIANQRGLTESGYRLVANTGNDGGQTVFHLHLHLLGGRPMSWPPG